MTHPIDYYFFPSSPWAYLGSKRLTEMAQRHRAEVRVLPVEAGRIFPETGGLPLAKRPPARKAYRLVELERWRRFLDMPLNTQPAHFPTPDSLASCFIIAAGRSGGDPLRLANAIGRALWAEERNIDDLGTLQAIATETGHHADSLTATALDPETRHLLSRNNDQALAAGVFGAPSYVYRGELFWGQDRLDFLERALAGA